jgi:hypothetical protein
MNWLSETGYASDREKYHAYLASREWAVLKEQVRARSGGKCERCNKAPYEQTHHVTYIRKYNEALDDLQAVCAPCHEFVSGKRNDDPAQPAKPKKPVTFYWHEDSEREWQDRYVFDSLLELIEQNQGNDAAILVLHSASGDRSSLTLPNVDATPMFRLLGMFILRGRGGCEPFEVENARYNEKGNLNLLYPKKIVDEVPDDFRRRPERDASAEEIAAMLGGTR